MLILEGNISLQTHLYPLLFHIKPYYSHIKAIFLKIISRLYIIINTFPIIIDPENHQFLVVSLIFQPLFGRVYVNLLEGNISLQTRLYPLLFHIKPYYSHIKTIFLKIISRLYIIINPFTIIIDTENHQFFVVSLIFQPLFGRVYVNLLEGIYHYKPIYIHYYSI